MFSKSRINEPGPKAGTETEQPKAPEPAATKPAFDYSASTPKAKPPASVLSSDLTITGNIKTTGDIQVEGVVDGDIRAHLLTVGESATIKGEIVADDIVVNGRVIGRVRGLKVRLTSTARVEGDIIHKTIAIESGAHFEGSVQRQEDPLAQGSSKPAAPKPAPATAS
ncbi:polymer-forming cytoskeletal protein [Defluviimonas sp. WL0024]|uniref:Polymer-forming cytoskeletal protein n=1 Tax=Albidovulum salinarum TaxID=2984153 RepID=A0ABT2X6Y7_9RHOB|nr:polymer-forming cytoskeletal protein [Defluviimonas sp. WL0024]MCU9849726.1 polymer-forming cytoskeletal protein [Defluviimonas sp. WL0024]